MDAIFNSYIDNIGSVEQIIKLEPFSFWFTLNSLRTESLKKHMIKPGLELIKQFNLLPLVNLGEVSTISVADFQNQLSGLNKGVMLLNGIPANKKGNGHAMLLEFDKQNGIYIFYDNNRGYYQWNDLQSCLKGIKARFRNEKYGSCEVVIHPFN